MILALIVKSNWKLLFNDHQKRVFERSSRSQTLFLTAQKFWITRKRRKRLLTSQSTTTMLNAYEIDLSKLWIFGNNNFWVCFYELGPKVHMQTHLTTQWKPKKNLRLSSHMLMIYFWHDSGKCFWLDFKPILKWDKY